MESSSSEDEYRPNARVEINDKKKQRKRRKKGTGDIPCTICGKLYVSKSSLHGHMRSHNNNYSFRCRFCDKGFLGRVQLKIHENSRLQGHEMGSTKPRFRARSPPSLVVIVPPVFPPVKFSAKKKNSKDQKARKKINEKERGIGNGKEKTVCCESEGCDKLFATEKGMNIHKRIVHGGKKSFHCSRQGCSKVFQSPGLVRWHLREAHPGEESTSPFSLFFFSPQNKTVLF